eukprot:7367308-Prymnesium_polylepis.1
MQKGHEAQRQREAKKGKAPATASRQKYLADLLASQREQETPFFTKNRRSSTWPTPLARDLFKLRQKAESPRPAGDAAAHRAPLHRVPSQSRARRVTIQMVRT